MNKTDKNLYILELIFSQGESDNKQINKGILYISGSDMYQGI